MKCVLSCEHASNFVPHCYRHLFQDEENILASHRAYDPGAAALALRLAEGLHGSLHLGNISRLLVDLNRSPTNRRSLFSAYSRNLPYGDREMLRRKYYLPYRQAVETGVRGIIVQGETVLHLSLHSFSPGKGTEERRADIGLLYDPARESEKWICVFLQKFLQNEIAALRVRRNYPYRGKSDGFATYIRRRHTAGQYAGVEIEMNQALLLSKSGRKKRVVDALVRGIGNIVKCFGKYRCQRSAAYADKRYGILD
jgi:predicted N-formylglutamate amidohydrolase